MKRKQKCFTQNQIQELTQSKFIIKVFENRIIYSDDFKKLAIQQYSLGKPPVQIFVEAELNINLIGRKNAFNLIKKWAVQKDSIGDETDLKKQIFELKAKNAYLEAELDLIKKLN